MMSRIPQNVGYEAALFSANSDMRIANSIDPTSSGENYRAQLGYLRRARTYALHGLQDTSTPIDAREELENILVLSGTIQRRTMTKVNRLMEGAA